ncbi:MAG: type I DNA topoisomerase [Phycisphaeraceae bacterium]
MAKSTTPGSKTAPGSKLAAAPKGDGKQLVIVESPAKAKTINKYLGSGYIVLASVGHVRDLPKRNPKGVKNPVPGVDLEHDFQPTYEIISERGKAKTVAELKRTAKKSSGVWLATDLDREGESIAWHLAEALGIELDQPNRVVFNAITKDEIRRAFEHPRKIDLDKVNAQQARRILDRIVGYQVSPLLWKKVAEGLSAGRVPSVAVRVIVEREREIEAFIPEEYWKITGYFTTDLSQAASLAAQWEQWLGDYPKMRNNRPVAGRSGREKLAWLAAPGHAGLLTELVEVNGEKFEAKNADDALRVAQLAGFQLADKQVVNDPNAKGPAQHKITLVGLISPTDNWLIKSIETKRTRSRPYAPFITSTLQQTAANQLGFAASTTMRTAQQLYEGIDIRGLGSVGLITYMRTDSTHISGEALGMARDYILHKLGEKYLPEKPNFYASSNKAAQEAHEAIRPTDVSLHPDDPAVKASLDERQHKLYKLIWQRFVACQMTAAEWDTTTYLITNTKPRQSTPGSSQAEAERSAALDSSGGSSGGSLTFRGSGRTLVFDGFYKVVGAPHPEDEAILPPLAEQQHVAPLQIDPTQSFTSPPPRYTEASLVKKLEAEGIGRPSTYASIIDTIVKRKYVDKNAGRFFATDMGMVVTDKLVEAFPQILDVGYTRQMEAELDAVEEQHHDWVKMLHNFYGPFKLNLAQAHEGMSHAKAEMQPAPYPCPTCGAGTVYRFGRNGRFLSCSRYPDCKFAAPIDRKGQPQTPEASDIACPVCSKPMMLRKGRFGPFLSCSDYPACKGIINLDRKGNVKLPAPAPLATDIPCPKCEAPLYVRQSKRGPWLSCSTFPKCRGRLAWSKLDEKSRKKWELALLNHIKQTDLPTIRKTDGKPIGENYKPRIAGGEDDTDDAEISE